MLISGAGGRKRPGHLATLFTRTPPARQTHPPHSHAPAGLGSWAGRSQWRGSWPSAARSRGLSAYTALSQNVGLYPCFQNHLKNVLQTLIAHMSTWQTRTGGQFQHSFGNSSSGCGLTRSRLASCVPECRYEGDRREAVSAMLAAQSTLSADEGKPISLFHFRDALMVSHLLILQDN